MATDLRTQLNSCDTLTGVQGDGPTDIDSTIGFVYQGTNSWTTQHTNTPEHMWGPVDGGTADLSDATCYIIVKDNLVQNKANGGIQYVLGVTNNRIGYGIGGNDEFGIPLDEFWNGYKLDVSARALAAYSNVYTGSEGSINFAAINSVGLGTVHLAKAQGNVDNIKIDRMSYHVNGSPAVRIEGGTTGTPETMADVVSDSITNGWALFANPTGLQYSFHGPTQWGNPTSGDTYFNASNEQWTWFGGEVAATHFPFSVVGNGTGTTSYILDTVSITNVGTRAEFDLSDVNIDTLEWTTLALTGLGDITFPPASATRFIKGVTFNDCGQAYMDSLQADLIVFNGTASTEASMAIDTPGHELSQTGFTFNRVADVPAVVIRTPGIYNLTDWTFNGYDGASGSNLTPNSGAPASSIYNLSGGAVTLNLSGTTGVTVLNGPGSATTVNDTITITVTGVPNGLEARIRLGRYTIPGQYISSVTGNQALFSIDAAVYGGRSATLTIGGVADDSQAYERQDIPITIPNQNQTLPVGFLINPSYS